MNLSYTLFIATLIIMTLFSILNHNYIQMYLKITLKKKCRNLFLITIALMMKKKQLVWIGKTPRPIYFLASNSLKQNYYKQKCNT